MAEVSIEGLALEARPEIICEGVLNKRSRGRSTMSFLAKAHWNTRMMVLYSNKVLEYWEQDQLKGTLSLDGAIVKDVEPFEADEMQNAFEIINPGNEEKMLLATEQTKAAQEWKYHIRTVIENTWKRERKLEELSRLLCYKRSEYFTLDEAYNRSDLISELSGVGGKQRFEFVYYEGFLGALIGRVTSYLRVIGFQEAFLKACHTRSIRIRPYRPTAERNRAYQCSFPDGVLLIEFQAGQVEAGLEEHLGEDLCEVLGVAKHCRHV